MPLTLRQKRVMFSNMAARLVLKAFEFGYECAIDQVGRSQAEADANAAAGVGIAKSLHTLRLAIDLDLYEDERWLQNSDDYVKLGEWWKAQHPLCRWGGDFINRPDGRHFSVEHQGVK